MDLKKAAEILDKSKERLHEDYSVEELKAIQTAVMILEYMDELTRIVIDK